MRGVVHLHGDWGKTQPFSQRTQRSPSGGEPFTTGGGVQPHESVGEMNFGSLGKAGGEGKSVADILLFKVREIGQ